MKATAAMVSITASTISRTQRRTRRGCLCSPAMDRLPCRIKGGATQLFQSAKSRATDRHRAATARMGARPLATEPAHDAAEHQDQIGAPHAVELRRVAGEERNGRSRRTA